MATITRIIRIKPAGTTLKLHGAGDRLPWAPGPGAIPSEEPLLPRIETIVGMLASIWYSQVCSSSTGISQQRCRDWCTCTAHQAGRLIRVCGVTEIVGPFLVAKIRYLNGDEDTRVYINATTGLLDVEGIDRWVEAAELIRETSRSLFPRNRHYLRKEVSNILTELMDGNEGTPLYISAEELSQKMTKVSLDHTLKTARYGMIYSTPGIDLIGGLKAALAHKATLESLSIVVLAINVEGHTDEWRHITTVATPLGPKGSPVIVRIEGTSEELETYEDTRYSIALTPAPVTSYTVSAVHPRPPRPPLELYTVAYRISNGTSTKFTKGDPTPAYWPGTVLENYAEKKTCTIDRLAIMISYATSITLIKKIEAALKKLEAQRHNYHE